jgi:hypothetical protein
MSGIPGQLTSMNGPKAETAVLDVVQEKIYSYISMEATVVLYLLPGSAQHEPLGQNNPRGNPPMASRGERNPRRVPDPLPKYPGLHCTCPQSALVLRYRLPPTEGLRRAHPRRVYRFRIPAPGTRRATRGGVHGGIRNRLCTRELIPVPVEVDMQGPGVPPYNDVYPGFLTTQLGALRDLSPLDIRPSHEKLMADDV